MYKYFGFWLVYSLVMCFPVAAAEWAVTCGDDLYCIARIDLVDAKGQAAKFKIERSNLENGKVYITFGPAEPLAAGMLVRIETLGTAFSHEGPVEKVYGGNEMTFAETARGPIVEALRGAANAQVTVFFKGEVGTRIYDVPLTALTATLLEIDAKQDRIGRTDAIVAWGSSAVSQTALTAPAIAEQPTKPAPAQSDPAADEAPVGSGNIIYAVADLPPEIAAFASKFGCALEDTLPAWGANGLGMGGNMVMYTVPCQNGDVNIESYVASMKGGKAKLHQFENQPGLEPVWRETIISPGFDPASGILSTVAYDSPNFDCGRFEQHRYLAAEDGFELIAVRVKPNCDGVTTSPQEWPVEWTIAEMGG